VSERECRVLMANGEPACVVRKQSGESGPERVHLDNLDGPGTWGPRELHGGFTDVVARLRESHGATDLMEPSTGWGEFHPRMAWKGCRAQRHPLPGMDGTPYESYFLRHHAAELQAAHVSSLLLFERLADVFKFVEPNERNACAYGHELRHLLIAACTEVEAGWRGVLGANGYTGDRLRTNDYVKLNEPLRLHDWVVGLKAYPEFPPVAPFGSWSTSAPTQSLAWYEAYNVRGL